MNKSTKRDLITCARHPLPSILDEDDCTTMTTLDRGQKWGRGDQRLKKKRKTYFVDEAPKHRTAMGEYIIPKGGQPLTGLDFQYPGPMDYSPEFKQVQSSAPEWSIPGRDERRQRCVTPGPDVYDTSSPMVWNRRKVVLSSRFEPTSLEWEGPFEAGPSSYTVTRHAIGTCGPMYTIPKAKRDQTVSGHLCALLTQPGITTPAPNEYDVKECQRHRAPVAVLTGLPAAKQKQTWPGPCDYFPKIKSKSPGGVSMGNVYTKKRENGVPGPNKYNIGSLMGTGPAFSMTHFREAKCERRAPSPGYYTPERCYSNKEKIVMHTLLPERTPEIRPAPNKYDTRTKQPKCVGFSIRSRTLPTFPVSLNDVDSILMKKSPGPAAYFPHQKGDTGAEKRGPDFGVPYRKMEDGMRPAPWDYGAIDCRILSTKPRAPSYTMAARCYGRTVSEAPGPGDYTPQMIDHRIAKTMAGRWTSSKPRVLAGYHCLPDGVTKNGLSRFSGFTFKSRHSPQVWCPLSRRPLSARAD